MKNIKFSHLITLVLVTLIQGCIREDVLLPPVITAFSKNPVASEDLLTVSGNYFDSQSLIVVMDDDTVSVAGTPELTQFSIIVPVVNSMKEVKLYVQTRYGKSSAMSLTVIPPRPLIRKIIPDKAGVGKTIKVAGKYFVDGFKVYFKSPDQTNPIEAVASKISTDTLQVTVPAGLSPDAADVKVTSPSGESDPAPFTVLLPPKITSFTPDKGTVGTIVRIVGQGLTIVDYAAIGDVEAEILSVRIDLLELRIPPGSVTDTIHISSTGGEAKTAKKFEVAPAPTITSLDKMTAPVGADVTINGQNFTGAFEVKFANTLAVITSNTGTVIKTKVPATASSGKVSVTTPAGTGFSNQDFAVQGTPIISSFTPTFGGVGTKIILTGANLMAVTTARIGSKDLKINSKTDTQMEVEVLAGSVTGKISVISPGNTFETTDNFVIAGTPQITNVTPASGTIGTVVTITGINFPGAPTVTFTGGVNAAVSKATPTEIICQVPAGATTGKISVNGANSPSNFTVSAKAIITNVTPLQGGVDKEVTITGSYFTGATIKFANNVTATKVGAGTDNQVVVKVPAGAVTGKITVSNGAGSTNSPADFQILPVPTISSFTPQSGPVGTPITITGTNLQYNPEVRFFNNILATVKSSSATQILVDVPAGAATGKISVRTDAVTTAVPSGTDFTVVGKPAIASIVPASGTINEKVTINGTNFANLESVTFDGVTTTTFISSTPTKIEVRVPATVNGTISRSINVNVKTQADNSNNQTFSLLGTPTITKLSPNNNPAAWAFLIEGTNLSNVKKVTLDGIIPNTSETGGWDLKGFNYLTTKVPATLKPPSNQNKTLALYYTSDDFGVVTTNYQVLSVPPPGVFPPSTIILPPPLPVTYAQNDLSASWSNDDFISVTGDSAMCWNIRGNFFDDDTDLLNTSGTFCRFEEFLQVFDEFDNPTDFLRRAWTGTWNNGIIQLTSGGLTMTGQVHVEGFTRYLILTDNNGRQLRVKQGGCSVNDSNSCEN